MHHHLEKAQAIVMAVDMTCIDLSVEDLLRCSFGLSRREASLLLRMLAERGWLSIADIASAHRKDRSVVQRGLSSLLSKGLIEREHHNRAEGGYEYLYRSKGKNALKRVMLEKSEAFGKMVRDEVRSW